MASEASYLLTTVRRINDGNGTPGMCVTAIDTAQRAIDYATELGDDDWAATARRLKAGLEEMLVNGLPPKPSLQPRSGPELTRVERPLAEARIKAGRKILQQVRCAAGTIDIFDVTANELIECKKDGGIGSLAEAASQLQRYAPHFVGAALAIAVPRIEERAQYIADILRCAGFRLIEVEK